MACFCFLHAEIEFWKARDGAQGSWRLSLQPGSTVIGSWGVRAQITPCFSHHRCNLAGALPTLGPLSFRGTVRRKDGHVAENRSRGISEQETGLPLIFFLRSKASYQTQ